MPTILQASSFWKKSCVLVQEGPILHKGNECTSCSIALWQVMHDSKVYNQSQNVIPCSDKDNVLHIAFFFFHNNKETSYRKAEKKYAGVHEHELGRLMLIIRGTKKIQFSGTAKL